MLKLLKNQKYYIFFIIVSFAFLVTVNSTYMLNFLYTYGTAFGAVSAIAFVAYAFIYLLGIKTRKRHDALLNALFLISVLDLFAMFLLSGPVSGAILSYNAYALYTVAITAILIIIIAFPLFLGAYLVRGKTHARIGYAIFGIVVVLVFVYFVSHILIKYFVIDDEVFISISDIHYLLSGINPYQHSLSQQIYRNSSSMGYTFTTNNELIGILNYPALYLFSYVPFYFLASPTLYNMEHVIVPFQVAVFFTLLLFTIAFSIDKKYLKSPLFGVLVFLSLIFSFTASAITYLMLVLLIIAYKKTGTKYSWLFLGLCLAVQELIWIPVILLVVYTLNNYGIRKGAYDTIGAVAVFLAVNSYFIALGPAAFFNGIFNPLQKLIMPLGSGIFGFIMLVNYHVLLSAYTAIFGIAVLMMIVAIAYINNKLLVGLFSIVPFLFLARSSISYYTFFVAFIFVTLLVKERSKGNGFVCNYLHRRKYFPASVILALAVLMAIVVYSSHASYVKGFDVAVSGQSLSYNATLNETVYTGRLSYSNLSTGNVHIMFAGYGGQRFLLLGLFNYSIIGNPAKCNGNDISCLFNVNLIALNGSSGNYTVRAYFPAPNSTARIRDARLMVYSGEYVYVSDSISEK
ncbi:MAG: hypothetical protein KGI06_02360 [Candidatus Micrarchaeota archaeon]|nr:hypothetical protein [Candidatus Micrarchaeota archaeon]